jgi:hypothetical protein
MSYYAKVENGIVVQVIAAEQDFIDSGLAGDPLSWIQTSYNTRGGVHYGLDGQPDGGIPLRKNYAGIGYVYDTVLDAFIPLKPYPSWLLNTQTCLWEPPIPCPNDGKKYFWNEDAQTWDFVSDN